MTYLVRLFVVFLFLGFSFLGFGQDMPDSARVQIYLDSSKVLLISENLNEALEYGEKALDICLRTVGDQDTTTANVYNQIGMIFQKRKEFKKALSSQFKALDILKNNLGEKNSNVTSSYYNIGITYSEFEDFNNAKKYFQKVLDNINLYDEKKFTIIKYYLNFASFYQAIGELHIGLEFNLEALKIASDYYGDDHYYTAVTNFNTGYSYYRIGDNDSALNYYKKIYNSRMKFSDKGLYYNNMGAIFMEEGELDKAKEYYQKALELRLKLLDKNHPLIGASLNNIGVIHQYKGEYEISLEYYEKSLKISLASLRKRHPNISMTYTNIGEVYFALKKYEEALEYHNKSLDLRVQYWGNEHPSVAESLNNNGKTYFKQGQFKLALEFYQKALAIYLKTFGGNHFNVANTHFNIANLYNAKGDYDKAIDSHQTALSIRVKELGKEHPSVAESYNQLGLVYLAQKKYENANENFKNAISCLEQMRTSFTSIESKQFHLSEKYSIFENSIKTVLEINSINPDSSSQELAFLYSEKGKSNLLLEALTNLSAKIFSGIPDSLLKKEYDLRINIAYFDKKRQGKINNGLSETDTTVLEISGKLFDLNREYETLKERFRNDYPQYYKAKYDLSTISLEEVQNELLQPRQTLLEYMVGDSSIFLFLIQKDNYEVHEIKHDFPLQDWVRKMTKDGIYGYYALSNHSPLKTNSRRDSCDFNYTNAAQQLYEKLIAPVADRLTKNLIIIPDGILGYVPFEALLSEVPPRMGAFKAYPFLIKKHQISYNYSATLLKEMRQKQHHEQPSKQLLAMAPFFQGDVSELAARIDSIDLFINLNLRDSLNTLDGSGEEVAAVNKIWNGKAFYGPQASLFEFQQNASDYRILHLSTHGKADDRVGDYAYLAFGAPDEKGIFDKLYARDLYNYTLNADMVVLSACETGIGKLQKGEGIISLARAFAYAGAKSIFPTLWQVSDEKTKDLFIGFYKYLKKGKPKDEALRLAKLNFLKDNAGEGFGTHPFFWAGLIGIGDMSAIR